MILITFAPAQAELAQDIRGDLAGAPGADQQLLIVLVTRESLADAFVQAEIEAARQRGDRILPLQLDEGAALPVDLPKSLPALDFRGGYQREQLLSTILSAADKDESRRRANRRALLAIGALSALMFAWAIAGIGSGTIAFPVDEYNEEATLQAEWIDGLVSETLEAAQPRSTADALNFAATFAAAPTRLHFYIRGTATALAQEG